MIQVEIDMNYKDDSYELLANVIVGKWNAYLQQKGYIHGVLAHSEELMMLIAQEMRKENGFST